MSIPRAVLDIAANGILRPRSAWALEKRYLSKLRVRHTMRSEERNNHGENSIVRITALENFSRFFSASAQRSIDSFSATDSKISHLQTFAVPGAKDALVMSKQNTILLALGQVPEIRIYSLESTAASAVYPIFARNNLPVFASEIVEKSASTVSVSTTEGSVIFLVLRMRRYIHSLTIPNKYCKAPCLAVSRDILSVGTGRKNSSVRRPHEL